MRDPRVPLRNPIIAGVLAFLIPGLGHWYQGRRLKATINFVGVLTLFFWGMILGNWQPVYSQLVLSTDAAESNLHRRAFGQPEPGSDEFLHLGQAVQSQPQLSFAYGYGAQFLVGLPALPALVQEMRFRSDKHDARMLDTPINASFRGVLIEGGRSKPVKGKITLEPVRPEGSRSVSGLLKAVEADGSMTEYPLGGTIRLGRAVFGSPERLVECNILGERRYQSDGIKGFINRPVWNWYQAPRDNFELDRLHGVLSRKFDIATVFTWIAGLLNLLAIWDAVDGPAYGYGDEKPDDQEADDKKKSEKKS
ncbi:MAG: DUF6677 family protein [Planctomycetota bacterium]